MTEQTQNVALFQNEDLNIRNREVVKCYGKVVEAAKLLLKPFTSSKYRTIIEIDHTRSGKETNLILECMTCFFNITVANNKSGYTMIYLTFNSSAIERFGARLYNRALRVLFKYTMLEKSKANVEDAVRVNNPREIEPFFVNRLSYGESSYVKISIIDKE